MHAAERRPAVARRGAQPHGQPGDHIILPELLMHAQTGPFVRQGDDPWLTVVRWTLLALIEAEQLGISSETLEEVSEAPNDRVRRFLGRESPVNTELGLPANWTERVVAEVGNYGQIFNRTLGEGSRLKLPRGAKRSMGTGRAVGRAAVPVA